MGGSHATLTTWTAIHMPTSALLPDVDKRSESTSSNDRQPHWVCVTVREHPFISLCGELTSGIPVGPTNQLHEKCKELASEHAASCSACAYWAAKIL